MRPSLYPYTILTTLTTLFASPHIFPLHISHICAGSVCNLSVALAYLLPLASPYCFFDQKTSTSRVRQFPANPFLDDSHRSPTPHRRPSQILISSMSNLINSYFIEPVFRQARRFGNTPVSESACDDIAHSRRQGTGPSHVHRPSDPSDLRDAPKTSLLAQRQLPITSLGQAIFDRFAPLLSNNRQATTLEHPAVRPDPLNSSSVMREQGLSMEESSSIASNVYSRRSSLQLPSRERTIQALRILSDQHAPMTHTSPSSRQYNEDIISKKQTAPLPEDDGKSLLRQRILAIWNLQASTEEKAIRMHAIMNESYHATRSHYLRPMTSESDTSQIRPLSSDSFDSLGQPASSELCGVNIGTETSQDPSNPYNIQPDDMEPCYRPQQTEFILHEHPNDSVPSGTLDDSIDNEPEMGCVHYKRNVKVQCFACKTWWPCRLCHDEANLGHELPRHLTENMLCMTCKTPGPCGQYCKNCSNLAANYYCEVCKLWDDSCRSIYHCLACGICRLGEGLGKDYEHCKKCNVCIAIGHHTSHKCIERALECDCPICSNYMFNSSEAVVSLPCGHYLHRTCYDEYIADAYQCPVCKKSAINMELHWRKLEDEIASQPMPARWRGTIVEVRCNDCGGKSRCAYHWLGCRCSLCDSFNTVEVQVIGRDGEDGVVDAITETRNRPTPRTVGSSATIPQAISRSYFHVDEEDEQPDLNLLPAVLTDGRLAISNTAYEMLSRMTRSLSPIRHYFETDGEDGDTNRPRDGPASERELEELGFWNDDSNSDEYEYEDYEDGDEEDDDEEEDDDDVDDDEEESDSDDPIAELDHRLIGHR